MERSAVSPLEFLRTVDQLALADGAGDPAVVEKAKRRTISYLASAVRAGAVHELEALVRDLSQTAAILEIRRKGPSPDIDPHQHIGLLYEVVTALRQVLLPALDARNTLMAESARRIVRALYASPELLQAAQVRTMCGVNHQATLNRTVKSLVRDGYVAIHRGPGNTAWYYLTPSGRIFLEAAYPELAARVPGPDRAPERETNLGAVHVVTAPKRRAAAMALRTARKRSRRLTKKK